MNAWLATFIPILSVALGSGLTLLGQALSDHRTVRREMIIQKKNFQVQNFDFQRTTLLEMQETIETLARHISIEAVRRNEMDEYSYFDQQPFRLSEDTINVVRNVEVIRDAPSRIRSAMTDDEVREVSIEVQKAAQESRENAQRIADQVEKVNQKFLEVLESRSDFLGNLIDKIAQLKVNMYKVGWPSLQRATQEYSDAAFSWHQNLVSQSDDILIQKIRQKERKLREEISRFLLEGPYADKEP